MKLTSIVTIAAVVLAAQIVDGGERPETAGNGQLLRVPRGYARPENRDAFWKAIEAHPGAFSELALFACSMDKEPQTIDFHRASLPNVLSRGVYCDAGALRALNARGFGEFVGFALATNMASRTAGSRDLAHPLNLPGCRARHINYSLSGGRENGMPLLERLSDGAASSSPCVCADRLTARSGRVASAWRTECSNPCRRTAPIPSIAYRCCRTWAKCC